MALQLEMESHCHFALHAQSSYLDEGLGVQGGVGLLQPYTLLLVLFQSQGVDGEQGHVGLEHMEHTHTGNLLENRKIKGRKNVNYTKQTIKDIKR